MSNLFEVYDAYHRGLTDAAELVRDFSDDYRLEPSIAKALWLAAERIDQYSGEAENPYDEA